MHKFARMMAIILVVAAVAGVAEPAAQTAIATGKTAVQITPEGIGWD